MNQKLKSKISFLLLILVTIIVLYFVLKDNFIEIIHYIITLNPWWFFVSFSLLLIYWFLKSFILYKTARHFKKDYKMKQAFRNILLTQFFNGITPFATGGQPFQVYSLKKEGIPLTSGTNIIIQDCMISQIAQLLLGTVAIIVSNFTHLYPQGGILTKLVLFGFGINLVVVIVLILAAFALELNYFFVDQIIKIGKKIKLIKNVKETENKWKQSIKKIHDGSIMLTKDWKYFIGLIVLNIVALLFYYVIPMTILFGLGDYHSLRIGITILTSAYVTLIGAFIPIPGGTGGLEYSFMVFYQHFISGNILKTVMLLWRFLTYYFGIIVGAVTFHMKEK